MNTKTLAVLTNNRELLAELRSAVLNNFVPPRAMLLDLIDLLAERPETPAPLALQRQHAYVKGLREAKEIVFTHLVETGRKSRDLAAAHGQVMAKTSIAYASWGLMQSRPDHVPVAGAGEPREALHDQAEHLLSCASVAGLVLTIERRSLKPWAMGHADYAISTRPTRGAA